MRFGLWVLLGLIIVCCPALAAENGDQLPAVGKGTVGLWRLDRGPKAFDESENEWHGAVRNAEFSPRGRFGNCLKFSEHNASVEFPDLRVSLPKGCFEIWLEPAGLPEKPQLILAMASNAGWRYRGVFRPDGRFEFALVDYQGQSQSVVSKTERS